MSNMMSIQRFQAHGLMYGPIPGISTSNATKSQSSYGQIRFGEKNPATDQTLPVTKPKSTPAKSSFLGRMFRTLSYFAFGTVLTAGCFVDGSPRPFESPPVTVQELQLSTAKGLDEDEFAFSPLDPPFHLDLPGTKGLNSKHLVLIINTNRGENNRLGLYQPKGLTKAHLETALKRTTHTEVQSSLNKFLEHFDLIDADQNGVITLSDIQKYVNKNYTWYHRPFFSKAEASQQAEFYLAQQFGIQD
jgi:hypothetical protein